jgi:hypothetical protein
MATPFDQHQAFLHQFLNKTLRILVDDDRIFVGTFKCTDKVCFERDPQNDRANMRKDLDMVLCMTHEYRPPEDLKERIERSGAPYVQVEYTSRFVGLVVVPGNCIKRVELEQSIHYGTDGTGYADTLPYQPLPPADPEIFEQLPPADSQAFGQFPPADLQTFGQLAPTNPQAFGQLSPADNQALEEVARQLQDYERRSAPK